MQCKPYNKDEIISFKILWFLDFGERIFKRILTGANFPIMEAHF